MSDWSPIGVSGGWDAREDAEGRLRAENAELASRLQRLGPALTNMARDLATVRRENVALKRENLRLRGLDTTGGRPADAEPKRGIGSSISTNCVKA
jgi:hypothetical protein